MLFSSLFVSYSPNTSFLLSSIKNLPWFWICVNINLRSLFWGKERQWQERRNVISIGTSSKRLFIILILFIFKWNMICKPCRSYTPSFSPLPELAYSALLYKIYSYILPLSRFNSNIISSVKPFQLSQEEKELNNHWLEWVKLTKWKFNGAIILLCWFLNICMNNVRK